MQMLPLSSSEEDDPYITGTRGTERVAKSSLAYKLLCSVNEYEASPVITHLIGATQFLLTHYHLIIISNEVL